MPVMDTLTVFIHRLRRGQSPFVGGKDHTTHHLAYLGLSDRQVFYALAGLTIVCNAAMVMVYEFYSYITPIVTFIILMSLVVLFLLIQFVYLQAKPAAVSTPEKLEPLKVKA